MTPVAESYTISKELTGYTEDQTINPQELSLWRVLEINNDGTIDMISVYTSSTVIRISGRDEEMYKNIVGFLNRIASVYENSKYTIGSRCPGYNGQTQYIISDLSVDTSGMSGTGYSGWQISREPYGGGDNFYQKDFDSIQKIFGDLKTSKVDDKEDETNIDASYWIASRFYLYTSSTKYGWFYHSTTIKNGKAIVDNWFVKGIGWTGQDYYSRYFRPIVTLKPNLDATGEGTLTNPWLLK